MWFPKIHWSHLWCWPTMSSNPNKSWVLLNLELGLNTFRSKSSTLITTPSFPMKPSLMSVNILKLMSPLWASKWKSPRRSLIIKPSNTPITPLSKFLTPTTNKWNIRLNTSPRSLTKPWPSMPPALWCNKLWTTLPWNKPSLARMDPSSNPLSTPPNLPNVWLLTMLLRKKFNSCYFIQTCRIWGDPLSKSGCRIHCPTTHGGVPSSHQNRGSIIHPWSWLECSCWCLPKSLHSLSGPCSNSTHLHLDL